jgi:N-acetylglucosamine-6-sulfatase
VLSRCYGRAVPRFRWRLGTAGIFVVLAAIVSVAFMLGGDRKRSTKPAEPAAHYNQEAPNVVVVMTDDQAVDTMRAMPRTRHLVGRKGVRFSNSVVSFPLCCPSRATFLTGQYAHNHGVIDNHPPRGGYPALDVRATLPVWLSRAGYRTGFVGKFLNGYGKRGEAREVPPGWSDWYALPTRAKQHPFNYQLNENGELVGYGDRNRDYKTQVLADKASGFVRDHAGEERPFFLWVATNAPHLDGSLPKQADRDPEPDPRDRGRYDGEKPPRKGSVDEEDVSDKPRPVRNRSRLSGRKRRKIEKVYVSQLESVVAVDRLVKQVVKELRRQGVFEETVVMFTSDNGFLRGEHRIDSGKSRIYEESIRVPLLIRGPGFPEGEREDRVVANVDLAPTILELAGATAPHEMDGRSLVPFDAWRDDSDRAVLLETFDRGGHAIGVRTRNYVFARQESGELELYDLERDPEQLESVHDDPRYAEVRARLAAELARLRDCAGVECR